MGRKIFVREHMDRVWAEIQKKSKPNAGQVEYTLLLQRGIGKGLGDPLSGPQFNKAPNLRFSYILHHEVPL